MAKFSWLWHLLIGARGFPPYGLALALVAVAWLVAGCAPATAEPAYHKHPAADEVDPYRDWKYTTKGGMLISCCRRTHCGPAPYRWETGEVQLPNGEWIDPREYVAPDSVPPVIFWSSSMERDDHRSMAHACVVRGKLRCVALPGDGV